MMGPSQLRFGKMWLELRSWYWPALNTGLWKIELNELMAAEAWWLLGPAQLQVFIEALWEQCLFGIVLSHLPIELQATGPRAAVSYGPKGQFYHKSPPICDPRQTPTKPSNQHLSPEEKQDLEVALALMLNEAMPFVVLHTISRPPFETLPPFENLLSTTHFSTKLHKFIYILYRSMQLWIWIFLNLSKYGSFPYGYIVMSKWVLLQPLHPTESSWYLLGFKKLTYPVDNYSIWEIGFHKIS